MSSRGMTLEGVEEGRMDKFFITRVEEIAICEFFEAARRGSEAEKLAAADLAETFGYVHERQEFGVLALNDFCARHGVQS